MTKVHERAAALIFAIMFLVATFGTTGFIVWQIIHEGKNNQTSPTPTTANKLEGTKLANFTPVASVSELQKVDVKPGSGEEVKPGASVTAHYTGALAKDGIVFQSSHDQPGDKPADFTLTEDNLIKGWIDGVPGMKVGGTRRLIIPAALAYGDKQKGNIPPNSDLVFDIEVTAAHNTGQKR